MQYQKSSVYRGKGRDGKAGNYNIIYCGQKSCRGLTPFILQDICVQYMKGVGPSRAKLFANLGVKTIEDLLYFFPRRYEDRTHLTPLSQLKVGQEQTFMATVLGKEARRSWYTHKAVCEIVVGDQDNKIFCVWFNQPYMSRYFQLGDKVVVFGKLDQYKNRLQIVSPEYEIIGNQEDESLNLGRIVPVYPLTKGLSQRVLRKIIRNCLDQYASHLKEVLPYSIRKNQGLENLVKSLNNIHFPESFGRQSLAYKRVAFEEFFLFQLSVLLRRQSIVEKKGIAHKIDLSGIESFMTAFPFALTGAQKKVIKEIAGDMKRPSPMHRLLQGDVGSGKTVVALFGCWVARDNGYQSALMAPTEILARQHFETLQKLTKDNTKNPFNITLLVSQMPKKQKDKICLEIKNGQVDLVIGTHTLIQEGVDFKDLSLVVIDEQHKFGVRQRALLSSKGTNPDVLVMTATPIPRTLCHTLYGDLDISTIDELPPGRGSIKTCLYLEDQSEEVYGQMRNLLKEGRQIYVVYPIIEESATLDLKAAKEMVDYFKRIEFKDYRVGLVHGQMKRKQASEVMDDFKNKKIDILVATTILEVGVDVPNATVMVIEHAQRFGLAALHQLRGRIGRGAQDSICILVATPNSQDAQARIDAIVSTRDGFKIAQEDLLIRGPGEFFGRHQHGLNELKVANPVTQLDILEKAREEAMDLLKKDSQLKQGRNPLIKEVIRQRYPSYLKMVTAG